MKVLLIYFFGHGVLHIGQFYGICIFHFQSEETESKSLRNLLNSSKFFSGGTEATCKGLRSSISVLLWTNFPGGEGV